MLKKVMSFILVSCMLFNMISIVSAAGSSNISQGNTRGYNFGDGAFNKEELMKNFVWEKPFDVNDPPYPPEHLEKVEERREAGEKLRNDIIAASKAWMDGTGPNSFTIPSGVYRFVETMAIQLSGIMDFTVKAEPNVFFYKEGKGKSANFNALIIYVDHCENVTVIGDPRTRIVTDCIPFNSTQGKIISVDTSDKSNVKMKVEIMPGYVGYNEDMFTYSGVSKDMGYKIFAPDGQLLRNTMIGTKDVVYDGGSTYTITADGNWYDRAGVFNDLYKSGNYISMRLSLMNSVNVSNSKNVTIENVTTYGGDHFVNGGGNIGSIFFTNIRGARREGSGRLMGVAGSQQGHYQGAPVYTNCEFGYTWDDLINVLTRHVEVVCQESPREVLMLPNGNDSLDIYKKNIGSEVEFYDVRSGMSHGKAKVVAIEEVRDRSILDSFIASMSDTIMRGYSGSTGMRVLLDRNVDVSVGDVVRYQDATPSDAVFRDCYMHDGTCRLLVNGTTRTLIENCVFERNSLPSISMELATYWMEGPSNKDVIIRNNLFLDGRYGPFASNEYDTAVATASVSTDIPLKGGLGYCNERVLFEGNVFVDDNFDSILVSRAKDVIIRNNKFINPVALHSNNGIVVGQSIYGENPYAAVYLNSVKNAVVENNEIIEGNSYVSTAEKAFKIGKMNAPDADIVIRNNIINGQKQSGEIVKGSVPANVALAEEAVPSVSASITLTDIAGHWAEATINRLVKDKVVNGYEDNTFRPENNVAVNEFIKLAIASKHNVDTTKSADWAKPYIDKAFEIGAVKDGEFDNYDRPITRAEMMRIIVRLLGISTEGNDAYISKVTDYSSIASEFQPYVVAAYASGISTGDPDGTFRATDGATRAEAATVIERIMKF